MISPICFPYLGHQEWSVLLVAIVESGNMNTSDNKVAKEVMGQVARALLPSLELFSKPLHDTLKLAKRLITG